MQKKYDNPRPVRLKNVGKIVDAHLEKTGEKFSVLARDSLLAYLEKSGSENKKKITDFTTELRKNRADLARVGGNLNQVAFYFNSTGIVHETHLAKIHTDLQEQFKKISQTFIKIEESLGEY